MDAFRPLFAWIASWIPVAILAGLWAIMPTTFYTLACVFAILWVGVPWVSMAFTPIPKEWEEALEDSVFSGMLRGLLRMPFAFAAPLVVPIALLFTPRDANALPSVFRCWDNDVSINGDQGPDQPTYYCPGWDRRSYGARLVWLLRNRCSWMAQDLLGHRWEGWELADRQSWGAVGLDARNREGWTVNRAGKIMQLYQIWRVPFTALCFRQNVGFKVWAAPGDGRPIASAVYIPFSFLRWRG